MADHPDNFRGMTTAEFAKEFSQLRYDVLASYLYALGEQLYVDHGNDLKRGRTQLAGCLHEASLYLAKARRVLDAAWRICEPHMKEGA